MPLKRLRAGQACENCQIRKRRCDGDQPCSRCRAAGYECTYQELPFTKSKSSAVLDAIKALEIKVDALREQKTKLLDTYTDKINGGIAAYHKTSTERLLSWHVFNGIPSLKEHRTCFSIEYERKPAFMINSRNSHEHKGAKWSPYVTDEMCENFWDAFERNVNFWFPIMPITLLDKLKTVIMRDQENIENSRNCENFDRSVQCLAWLVLSLGCTCLNTEYRFDLYQHDSSDDYINVEDLKSNCFEVAYSMILDVSGENSLIAGLCLFYTALYFSYLQRPLQVIFYLNAAAFKCQILLSYQNTIGHDDESLESLRRLFYACFIIESDIDVELSEAPQSGCGAMQSTVPLPHDLYTHEDDETRKSATLYFLACISMRRLMNRVHTLTGDDDILTSSGVNMKLLTELDYQLESWRNVLPPYLKFRTGTDEAENIHQGHLRQRYYACKSVIYRPAFNYVVLHDMEGKTLQDFSLIEEATKCIWASYFHMANLRGFIHGLITDAWICALAMEGILLVFLMAERSSLLSHCIKEELTIPVVCNTIYNTERMLTKWMENAPEHSPTLKRSIDLMRQIRNAIDTDA